MSKNSNLHNAKNAKNDEFYTRRCDIENELKYYKEHFKDKVVYCNCDDPLWSNFFKYFYDNIQYLGIKKLITTHYEENNQSYKLEVYNTGKIPNDYDINNVENIVNDIPEPLRHLPVYKIPLEGDGDFRSEECIEILKEADIVVSNPPFSNFRPYVAQLIEHNKKFIIWGNNNAITYKEIFPLIKDNKMWLGYTANKTLSFRVPDDYKYDEKETAKINDGYHYGKVPAISVFTNLDIEKRNEEMILWANFDIEKYPMYDNYCAFNVDKCAEIPMNDEIIIRVDEEKLEQMKSVYGDDLEELGNGEVKIRRPIWGVPITVLNSFSPKQFEIIGLAPERNPKDESILRNTYYENAIQYKADGTTCKGSKVNDGPTILHNEIPKKFPYYTSETRQNKYLEVLYARILIRKLEYENMEHSL